MLPIRRSLLRTSLLPNIMLRSFATDIQKKEQSVESEYVNRREREALRNMLLALDNNQQSTSALHNILKDNNIPQSDSLAAALMNWYQYM